MVDWAAKREKAREKIAAVGVPGTVSFISKALNTTGVAARVSLWVLIRSREVADKGKPASITALLTTSDRDVENGVLECEGKKYQIVSIKQTGAGGNHLLTEVVANEL